jgi:large subunit ribosomal protein L24
MHVKKGDKVTVLVGKDKGVTGLVLKALPKLGKVVVAGANKMKKNQRPTKAGQKGQIVEKEYPIDASNVALASASK